jgi:hypothetical protein
MGSSKRQELPTDLVRARKRFAAWRKTRQVGTRIPSTLWKVAVKSAAAHGVCRAASVLGLDYYALKKRVEQPLSDSHGSPSARQPEFVELALPAISTPGECVVEFADVAGASLRVQLKGYPAPDLVALGRSFWNAD